MLEGMPDTTVGPAESLSTAISGMTPTPASTTSSPTISSPMKWTRARNTPTLIINNVVYGNGGRCIEAYVVTNFWIVNNTCYKNNLDPSIGRAGSITLNNAPGGF